MSFRVANGLWFMYRSCSHLVWAIILHMIIIILFCLLIMAISQGMLARWSHLIWLRKDHSTEVVLSLKRGGKHYPNEKQAEEEADLSQVDHGSHTSLCSCRSSSRAQWDTEGLQEAQFFFFFFLMTMMAVLHPLMALFPMLLHIHYRIMTCKLNSYYYHHQQRYSFRIEK